MTSLLIFIALAAVGITSAAVVYLRREAAVTGRRRMAALRGGSLVLLALLVANPHVPGSDEVIRTDSSWWVLVDGSPALDVPGSGGGTLREQAVERAVAAARRGARLALAGTEPEGIDTASLGSTGAREPVADLGPAILRLAEAGADSIVVMSPLRVSGAALERALAASPVPVRIERLGEPVKNAGVLELDLPSRVAAGDPVEGALTVFGEGGVDGDSVRIEVTADGAPVEARRIPLPGAGAPVRIDLILPAATDSGVVRIAARVTLDGDAFPRDDERVAHVRVGPPEGGIVLVSLLPDWEPRVLLPVLEATTGLEGEGYLRVGDEDRWLPLAEGGEEAAPVPASAFRQRLGEAALLVVHGVAGELPPWLASAAEEHPRVIHLPAGAAGARLALLSPAAPRAGEWTPDPELPPSPVAPFLSGLPLAGLPPLAALRAPGSEGGVPVLRVRSSPGGEALPAVVLRETARGRRAVALAQGFWRWANRSGVPREAYRGLWAGIAGWLLTADPVAGAGEVRPLEPVVARGRPIEWIVPGGSEGSLSLRLEAVEPAEAREGREVVLGEGGRGISEPLPPGRWRWEGEASLPPEEPGGDPEVRRGSGEVEVEDWTGALARPPVDPVPEAPEGATPTPGAAPIDDPGRPFRTHPLPYLLLVTMLCGEWILRRRGGLR